MRGLALVWLVCGTVAAEDKTAVRELYDAKCRQCHMADGNSPLEVMNFTDDKWAHGSTPEQVGKVIADGVPGTAMLAFKAQLSAEEIAGLAEYVRTFDKTLKPAKGKKK
jgi:mono/diheme cytochrome c family protein